MLPYLRLQDIEWRGRYAPCIEVALCIFLCRLSYPLRLHDIMSWFGKSRSFISSICGDIVKHLYHRFHAFLKWDSQRLTGQKLKQYADSIRGRSGADSIWGFLDGTLKPISRPLDDQRLFYSGHKHHHGIKYIGVVTPDGLISCLSSPFVGRRGDWYAWGQSGIAERAEEALAQNNPVERLYLYGDPAFTGSSVTIGAYRRPRDGNLTSVQQFFNTQMSRNRIAVEHGFGDVMKYWMKTDVAKNNQIGHSPVAAYYTAAVLLTNILNCLRGGNQVSIAFACLPPTLNEYMAAFNDI